VILELRQRPPLPADLPRAQEPGPKPGNSG
jgi:hypothetical protein